MKHVYLFVITLLLVTALSAVCFADSLTVMDEYELLTADEIADGVLLDPDSLFAYSLLEDGTVRLVRYTWVSPRVTVPDAINGIPVSWLGAYAFTDTPVKELELPCGIYIDAEAFSYSDVETILVRQDESA